MWNTPELTAGECVSGKARYARREVTLALTAVGRHVRAYRCPQCHAWHLTHLPESVTTRAPEIRRRLSVTEAMAILDDEAAT